MAEFVAPVPEGFERPDLWASLDVEEALTSVPAGAVLKGMYFSDLQELCRQAGVAPAHGRFVAFKDYPQRLYLEHLVHTAAAVHADVPLRDGLRRVGRSAYPTFSSTLVGRVVFGVLGNDLSRIFWAAAKGYELSMSHCSVETLEADGDHALVRLDQVFIFPDCYQVGVFEGAVLTADKEPEVHIQRRGPGCTDFFCRWRAPLVVDELRGVDAAQG